MCVIVFGSVQKGMEALLGPKLKIRGLAVNPNQYRVQRHAVPRSCGNMKYM